MMKLIMRKIFGAFLYALANSLVATLSFGIITFITSSLSSEGNSIENVLFMSFYVLPVSFISCFLSFFLCYFPVFTSLWVNLCAAIIATLVPVSWGLIAQNPLILFIIALSAIAPIHFGIKIFDRIQKHLNHLNSSSAAD